MQKTQILTIFSKNSSYVKKKQYLCTTKRKKNIIMKKAVLVDFSVRTRVIVDFDENKTQEENEMTAIGVAIQKVVNSTIVSPSSYINYDNATEVVEDVECPYGTIDTDN